GRAAPGPAAPGYAAPARARRGLTAVALALGLVGGLVACTAAPETDPGSGYVSGDGSVVTWVTAERGDPVELSGTAYDGSVIDAAELRGGPVVLNTWYAACPPCRAEAPDLVEIATTYAEQGVHVVGINTRDDA